MLATAEQAYKNLKLRQKGNKEGISLEVQEVETALDYAVLRYLKRHNQLPSDITKAFGPEATLESKREMAMVWLNA